ncbi:VOC family protein [Candidatus Woesearchaeota archaeon]|nr:VOC family protein [Candidatus Woesearchaeota archaeon]
MKRPVHFEITAEDPERASKFYKKIFGWDIKGWEGGKEKYWIVDTGKENPGINGGIMKRSGFMTQGTINTIEVPNLDEALKNIMKNGGSVAMDKHNIPGVGMHAYCKDTEGNLFGILQPDPNMQMQK